MYKDLHFTEDGDIKWSLINKLYSSLTTVYVCNVYTPQERKPQYAKSIDINDKLMITLLDNFIAVANDTFRVIIIEEQKNSKEELENIRNEYEEKFKEVKFRIGIGAYKSPQLRIFKQIYFFFFSL